VEIWNKKCPIKRMREHLIKENILTEAQIDEIDTTVRKEIEEIETFAIESPFPDPEEALEDVYS
jgi:TPP-dependent pyruvate/acetoin dehydrogenase alpha subunit